MATLSYQSVTHFFPESPEAIPEKKWERVASGGRRFGSYHLYLRTGASPTEDFAYKP